MATFKLDEKQSRESTAVAALGGALSGAATGASIGAPAGGIGALPGAVIGAVAGAALAGSAANVSDRGEQRAAFDAEQRLESAKAKALRDANQDIQGQARSTTARPKATNTGASAYSPLYATPAAGQTTYDAWQQGGAGY